MKQILFEYEMLPTTWFYLSSLMIIAIYFKFQRFWSVRNMDIIALIAFTPGILLIAYDKPEWGYPWLFFVGLSYLIRLLLDPIMVRRPLLEPNLSSGGLIFTCLALMVFLMGNLLTNRESADRPAGGVRLEQILTYRDAHPDEAGESADQPDDGARSEPRNAPAEADGLRVHDTGYPPFLALARSTDAILAPQEVGDAARRSSAWGKFFRPLVPILAQVFLVLGILLIGYIHFDNLQTGVAAASLYLLLPYTSQMTGRVDHVIPAALLVWAVLAYRRPILSGLFIGLAGGLVFFPLFLFPLWCSFYWKRGVIRFAASVFAALVLMIVFLVLTPESMGSYGSQLADMFGVRTLSLDFADGFWETHAQAYRIPIVATFAVICCGLAIWPAEKNLGTLLGCSAAVMLATQFWQPHQGGLHMAWYLPLMILAIFRPNLEDRVASTAVSSFWGQR